MFAKFNKEDFPLVTVTMSGVIDNNSIFDTFTDNWLSCYTYEKTFSFIFDMTNVGWVSIYYAYRMSAFIEKLRQLNFSTLRKSIIITDSIYLRSLLEITFFLQEPIAPVFIVYTKADAIKLYDDIESGTIKPEQFYNIPNVSYIPCL